MDQIVVQLLPFSIAIVAIVGGFTLAIVRVMARARLEELACRERIAAIQRGADPHKLPPLAKPIGDSPYPVG